MTYESAFAEITAVLSTAELADKLHERLQTVWNWRTRGVPPNRCKAVEALTGVSVRTLRPHDWADYWPEGCIPVAKEAA